MIKKTMGLGGRATHDWTGQDQGAPQVAGTELKDEGFLHERLLVLDHGAREAAVLHT